MSRGSTKTPLTEKPDDPAAPYSLNWLDSCYQETLLPGQPWHKINDDICGALARYLPKQMSQVERATVLARILGDGFMARYYPDVLTGIQGQAADTPAVAEEKKLALEASSWLKNQILKAAKQVGSMPDQEASSLSPDMQEFIRLTSQTFYKGLNRQLYKQEIEMTSDESSPTLPLPREGAAAVTPSDDRVSRIGSPYNHVPYTRSPAPQSDPILHKGKLANQQMQKSLVPPVPENSISSIKRERVRASVRDEKEQPEFPVIHSKPIELLAESLVKILERSPRRYPAVAKRLHGRLLPAKLRTFMWTESLYKAEREKLTHGANVEKVLRERFGRTVARNVGELRLARATQSPVHRVIENSVLEMYDNVPALASCRNKLLMREAVKTLNILYTYDKTYEPYLAMWLFPLQLAFENRRDLQGPEHVYELAMHLSILNESLFMQWNQVYAISDLVMYHLSKNDRPLHDHLQEICSLNVEVNAQDFVVELMKKERAAADKMLNKPESMQDVDSEAMLTNARIFIRKWIGEGFVSVLDTPATMFVWDQLFLQDWASTVFQDFSIVLILLLRDSFMSATDHPEMRSVFLNEPSKLLTADIQKAFLMLHDKRPYQDIVQCNRLDELVNQVHGSRSDSPEGGLASAPPGTTPQLPRPTPGPQLTTPAPWSTGHTPLIETPYLHDNSTGVTPVGVTPYPVRSTGATPVGKTPAPIVKKDHPLIQPDGEVPSTSRR